MNVKELAEKKAKSVAKTTRLIGEMLDSVGAEVQNFDWELSEVDGLRQFLTIKIISLPRPYKSTEAPDKWPFGLKDEPELK